MKTFRLLFLSLAAVVASAASAQTILNNTTLSGAVTNDATQYISLTSATGVQAPNPLNPGSYTYLYVDREAMAVNAVSGTTITVQRGAEGTTAKPHASGALVFVVPANLTIAWGWLPQGSCTRTNELALPRIHFVSGTISDCQGGQWLNGDSTQTTRPVFYRYQSPNTGAQTSGAAFGTNSTLTANSTYCTEIDLPESKLLTGLAPHIGTTGGTDKWIVGLYDFGGNLLAQSAAAGATVGSGNAWQAQAFTVPFYAVGPAQYFGCFITNGTTATADLVTTAKGDNILTKVTTGSSFVLPTSFTVPTSFNNVNGPYLYTY